MVSSVSSISSSSISALFRSSSMETPSSQASAVSLVGEPTGNTDEMLKAGSAIGKIIEIVSGMSQSASLGMFTMEGAERTEGPNDGWSLTKTGTGLTMSEADFEQLGVEKMEKRATGSGPDAQMAKAWLAAKMDGSMEEIDLSTRGVSATMTMRDSYNSDGTQRGGSGSWHVTGLDEFLSANTYADPSGFGLRDKATGKYATLSMNGTQYLYTIF